MDAAPKLIAIGGFAGAGKSTISRRLSRELAIPRLCSDTTGGVIREALTGQVEGGEAFRAGYEVLFALTEEFLRERCAVIVDTNLGWAFQWDRLDAIRAELPEVHFRSVLMTCPREVCMARVDGRARREPGQAPAAQLTARVPHLDRVWNYLEALDRPDVHRVDADREPDRVFDDVLGLVAA